MSVELVSLQRLHNCFLTISVLYMQWMVRLPLSRADQGCVRQLDVLPSGSSHRKQEGVIGRESWEPGGGGDGQCQGSGHPGCITQLYGSAKEALFHLKHEHKCTDTLIILLLCASLWHLDSLLCTAHLWLQTPCPFFAHLGPIIVPGDNTGGRGALS